MQRLVFWLVYPILWILSILPFSIFYIFSDAVFLLVYYVIRYRRKTVNDNLHLVFPEKSEHEIKRIGKASYRHLCDMFLEMVKSLSISSQELKPRFTFENIEELQKIREMEKSIILMCGHYASYEWMNALQLYGLDFKGFGVYKKIKNPFFDKMARDIRGRFDGELITTYEASKKILSNEKKGILGVYAMIADQSPKLGRAGFWTEFMNKLVPVFIGAEKLAINLDMTVVYLHVEKIKRGYYHASFKTLTYNPAEETEFEISRKYFKELEKQIRAQPEYYMWTHKRWKHLNAPIPEGAVVF